MKHKYNSQVFTPEQVESNAPRDLLDYLLEFNKKSQKSFMDVHITTDGYCLIIEWAEIDYEFRYEDGKFDFVDSDEEIFACVRLPDNSSMYVPRSEKEDALNDWLTEHPGWHKNAWGVWSNNDEEDYAVETVDE